LIFGERRGKGLWGDGRDRRVFLNWRKWLSCFVITDGCKYSAIQDERNDSFFLNQVRSRNKHTPIDNRPITFIARYPDQKNSHATKP